MDLGIKLYRFKTGTPARIDKKTVDFSKMTPQYGDEKIVPFSFEDKAEDIARPQVECYLTYTNNQTHEIIRNNLHRSPLYAGVIEGTGPRYCPSIEDKVVRFSDKERHQIFVEPEGENTNEHLCSGYELITAGRKCRLLFTVLFPVLKTASLCVLLMLLSMTA